jgi:hypothetical protein
MDISPYRKFDSSPKTAPITIKQNDPARMLEKGISRDREKDQTHLENHFWERIYKFIVAPSRHDVKSTPSAPRHKCQGLLRVDPERCFPSPP